MSPHLASLVFAAGILGLILLDREKDAPVSSALWLPVIWLWIGGSKMLSGWLQMTPQTSLEEVVDGSPLDRDVLLGLTALGVIVLISRRHHVGRVLASNKILVLFFVYCAISATWSDYPFVAFKRWIKTCGDLVMALIVLTDPNRTAALKRLLARVGFVLMPVSILLIRYYSDLGRGFDRLTGESTVLGVTMGKNLLGMICMISGLGAVWRLFMFLRGDEPRRPGPIVSQIALLGMVLWLFWKANSMTSFLCFILASTFIAATGLGILDRKRWFLHVAVATALSVATSILLLGVGGGFLQAVGRDPTLTGRTEIWSVAHEFAGNAWVGTGFESFWLGARLEAMWARYWWHPNEAHCGYLEMFLNLGWIGVVLFASVLARGYGNVVQEFRRNPGAASFGLGFFVAALAYNITETAVRAFHPLWVLLLLTTFAVPASTAQPETSEATTPASAKRGELRQLRAPRALPPRRPVRPPFVAGHGKHRFSTIG